MTIKTTYVYPPIPIRFFDYMAYEEGNPERQGFGPTEAEAIQDLLINEHDRELCETETCPFCLEQLIDEAADEAHEDAIERGEA